MMGGLAYMTGRPGDPLRAGSSVNDIMGGLFGAIGVMAALAQRQTTGLGQEIQSALFENNVFLVAQHMMQFAVTGQAAAPMPARVSAWGIYDIFKVKGDEQIFLAVVTDTAWEIFCKAFNFDDLLGDARLKTNNQRVTERAWMMPILRERLRGFSTLELASRFEQFGLPFAPITKPEDLFEDPHLNANGGLQEIELPNGKKTKAVLLPFTMNGQRLNIRMSPPKLGQHSHALLKELGYSEEEISSLTQRRTKMKD
jgi:hypothetical protein